MPERSKVAQLPGNIRRWLDETLVDDNFSGYEALSDELEARGYSISKSALGRYGKAFQDRLEAIKRRTEMAKALRDYVGDDEGAMGDALQRMMMDKLFTVMEEIEASEVDPSEIAKLTRAISDLTRSNVTQKRYMAEVKERAEKASEEAETIARSGGLSEDAVNQLKKQFLGIA